MTDSEIQKTDRRAQIFFWLAPPIAIAHLYLNILGTVSDLWQNAFHFASFLILAGLVHPYSGKGGDRAWAGVLDFGLVCFAAFSALFLVYREDAIYQRGVAMDPLEIALAIYLIFFAMVYTKRITGWIIPCLMAFSLAYVTFLGKHIGGVFSFSGLSHETVIFRSIYGDDALLGSIAGISSSFVFMFVLFGAFLMRSGAGNFIISFAQIFSGKMIGGPGFVALFASALSGTISGSSIANAASTGVITIPIMKKNGYDPKFAAGIEAAASTGGQIMPPIMGAGAFVMSSFTQIPYSQIVVAAIIPAIIYFATIGFYIRIEAKRLNLKLEMKSEVTAWQLIRDGGWAFFLPIGLLIFLLVQGFSPTYSGALACLSVIVCTWLTKNKMGIKAIWEALAEGARGMILTAIVLCSVGIIVNTIAMTGAGNTFSLMIGEWAQGNLFIALILIALASLILGMGLPVTASYIILGTLSAPILYQLILNQSLIQHIVANGVPESIKPILSLTAPEFLAGLSAPISADQASRLITLIPPDLLTGIYENIFPASHLLVVLMTAHLIIFWLSQDSNVTPPVCLVAFTTAAIAKTPPVATGFQAWKISKGLYLVPFLMAYTPLVSGGIGERLFYGGLGLLAMYSLTSAIQGFMHYHLRNFERLILLIAGLAALYPANLVLDMSASVFIIAYWLFGYFKTSQKFGFGSKA